MTCPRCPDTIADDALPQHLQAEHGYSAREAPVEARRLLHDYHACCDSFDTHAPGCRRRAKVRNVGGAIVMDCPGQVDGVPCGQVGKLVAHLVSVHGFSHRRASEITRWIVDGRALGAEDERRLGVVLAP